MVRSWQLIACAMAQPSNAITTVLYYGWRGNF
jgi:hypothetical protein